MSKTITNYPRFIAINAAEKELGITQWNPINERQTKFLKYLEKSKKKKKEIYRTH